MTDLTTGALIVLALAVAAWAGFYAARERPFDNPLFYDPKTSMLFGDAKASVSEVLGEVQQL